MKGLEPVERASLGVTVERHMATGKAWGGVDLSREVYKMQVSAKCLNFSVEKNTATKGNIDMGRKFGCFFQIWSTETAVSLELCSSLVLRAHRVMICHDVLYWWVPKALIRMPYRLYSFPVIWVYSQSQQVCLSGISYSPCIKSALITYHPCFVPAESVKKYIHPGPSFGTTFGTSCGVW